MGLQRDACSRGTAQGGGSWDRDTGRRFGSGWDQLRPDSEALREDSKPGQSRLGRRPVTPSGRATRPCLRPRRAVNTAVVRTGSRRTARRSSGLAPGVAAAWRITGRLSPAGLRLATSIAQSVAVRRSTASSGQRSSFSLACRAGK